MKTIVLDPGHGGDGHLTGYGAAGNGLKEKELNLLVARHCRAKLREYECKVVMTRDSDIDVSFADRANVARHNDADLLLSFHFNGYHDQRANGFESFIYNGSLSGDTDSYQHTIHNKIYSLLEPTGIRDRGKKRANFAILRLPPTSCVLPEYGFITNAKDAEVIKRPGMLKKLGEYTALGIADALGLPATEVDEKYRVVVASNTKYTKSLADLEKARKAFPTQAPFIALNRVKGEHYFRVVLAELDRIEIARLLTERAKERLSSGWIVSDWKDINFDPPEEEPEESKEPNPGPEPEEPELPPGLMKLLKQLYDILSRLFG